MMFRELNHAKCKTYLAMSESLGVSALIDPLRDRIDRYLAHARLTRLQASK